MFRAGLVSVGQATMIPLFVPHLLLAAGCENVLGSLTHPNAVAKGCVRREVVFSAGSQAMPGGVRPERFTFRVEEAYRETLN